MSTPSRLSGKQWALFGMVAIGVLVAAGYGLIEAFSTGTTVDDVVQAVTKPSGKAVAVKVVSPRQGGMDRTTTQPCSVLAFESVELQAAVSGFLKTLNVDIGSKVKKDEVLAEIEVPELVSELKHRKAVVEQAAAKVKQMKARRDAAKAELNASLAAVKQATAAVASAKATLSYRKQQYTRISELAASRTIEDRVKDEYQGDSRRPPRPSSPPKRPLWPTNRRWRR